MNITYIYIYHIYIHTILYSSWLYNPPTSSKHRQAMQKIFQPHLDPNLEIPRCGRKVPEGFADTVRSHLSVRSSCGALWGTVVWRGVFGEFMGVLQTCRVKTWRCAPQVSESWSWFMTSHYDWFGRWWWVMSNVRIVFIWLWQWARLSLFLFSCWSILLSDVAWVDKMIIYCSKLHPWSQGVCKALWKSPNCLRKQDRIHGDCKTAAMSCSSLSPNRMNKPS